MRCVSRSLRNCCSRAAASLLLAEPVELVLDRRLPRRLAEGNFELVLQLGPLARRRGRAPAAAILERELQFLNHRERIGGHPLAGVDHGVGDFFLEQLHPHAALLLDFVEERAATAGNGATLGTGRTLQNDVAAGGRGRRRRARQVRRGAAVAPVVAGGAAGRSAERGQAPRRRRLDCLAAETDRRPPHHRLHRARLHVARIGSQHGVGNAAGGGAVARRDGSLGEHGQLVGPRPDEPRRFGQPRGATRRERQTAVAAGEVDQFRQGSRCQDSTPRASTFHDGRPQPHRRRLP